MLPPRFDPFLPVAPPMEGPPRLVEADDVLRMERPLWVRVGAGALALALFAGSLAGLVDWHGSNNAPAAAAGR